MLGFDLLGILGYISLVAYIISLDMLAEKPNGLLYGFDVSVLKVFE